MLCCETFNTWSAGNVIVNEMNLLARVPTAPKSRNALNIVTCARVRLQARSRFISVARRCTLCQCWIIYGDVEKPARSPSCWSSGTARWLAEKHAWAPCSVKRIRNARRETTELLTYHKNVARIPARRLATELSSLLTKNNILLGNYDAHARCWRPVGFP